MRRRSEPALTREPGDLPVAVVLRADRVCRADGGEPERRHVWTAFSRRRVVRLTASAPLASVALRSGVPANVEVCFLFVHFAVHRSEEHTSALQSLMRNSYAVFCLK